MKNEYRLVGLGALAWATMAVPAAAQGAASSAVQDQSPQASEEDQASSGTGDIIVTARRRNETSLETPVVITAYSAESLSRLGVTNITDVAKLTPQFVISPAVGPYGGNLTLRGVASPSANAASEPATTVNIDGIPINYGGVVRMGNIDVGQIEVLKGPQALFFGKNSTGGILAIHSAEPTSIFKAQISGGYEFNARQMDFDGFVSGPISNTLTARLAGRFSRQRGYFKNVAPTRTFSHSPGTDEEGARVSLNWEPTDRLIVKLRGTYDNVSETGAYSFSQKIACPTGVSRGPGAVAGTDDCKANGTVVFAPFPGAAVRAATGNPDLSSDNSYLKVRQALLVSDITYSLTENLKLNSLTGYYHVRQSAADAATVGARFFIGDINKVKKDTFSQELRLTYSDPDQPFDFMLGGFYQDDDFELADQLIVSPFGTVVAPLNPRYVFPIRSKSYSAFAQAGLDVMERINISVGARYSHDVKRQFFIPPANLTNKFDPRPGKFNDLSPEATISYKPTEDLNFFASFKEGYKSGSYLVGGANVQGPTVNPAVTQFSTLYKPETTRGFEVGAKARLLDRQLRVNLAAYSYLYKDLQVTRFDPVSLANLILNASSARVKGIEGDFSFSPKGVPGLSINGAAAYNSARYASSFLSACYVGQTLSQGCTFRATPTAVTPNQQEFQGRPLPRAPKFGANLGMTYDTTIGSDKKVGFNINGVYSSGSFLSQELNPIGRAPKRVLLDGGLTFGSESGSYEFAFIGRNLTNRHYGFSGFQTPATGSGTGTAVGVLPDFESPVSRGREFWIRMTFRPSEF